MQTADWKIFVPQSRQRWRYNKSKSVEAVDGSDCNTKFGTEVSWEVGVCPAGLGKATVVTDATRMCAKIVEQNCLYVMAGGCLESTTIFVNLIMVVSSCDGEVWPTLGQLAVANDCFGLDGGGMSGCRW